MDENKMEILKMLQEGKINPEEAMELLKALEPSQIAERPEGERTIELTEEDYADERVEEGAAPGKKKRPKFLIIEVTKDGKKKVNVRIPLKMAKMAMRFIPKHAQAEMKAHGVEGHLNDLMQGLDELEPGEDFINVVDDDDNEKVRIYIQ